MAVVLLIGDSAIGARSRPIGRRVNIERSWPYVGVRRTRSESDIEARRRTTVVQWTKSRAGRRILLWPGVFKDMCAWVRQYFEDERASVAFGPTSPQPKRSRPSDVQQWLSPLKSPCSPGDRPLTLPG